MEDRRERKPALQGYLNDRLLLKYTLPGAGSREKSACGRKTDSVSYYDDYTVNPTP